MSLVWKKFQVTNLEMPNNVSSYEICSEKNQSLAFQMLRFPMEISMAPELHPYVWRGQEKFQMTNFTMPNNTSSMKYPLKSVPGLVDVGVPNGVGDGPRTPP